MAYLRSCSESPLLDNAVLKSLHAEGSQQMYPPIVVVDLEYLAPPSNNDLADLFYVDESKLCNYATDEEEWEDLYTTGMKPDEFRDKAEGESYRNWVLKIGLGSSKITAIHGLSLLSNNEKLRYIEPVRNFVCEA